MSRPSFFRGLAAAALFAMATAVPASANPNDMLTHLTFSGPFQVPGITLAGGTYRFHLADPDSGRGVIQVLSNDGVIVYSMFLTRPDDRLEATSNPTVTFMEVPTGVTPPVKTLYFANETRGFEFVYPRGGPDMTVHTNTYPQPVVTYTPIVTAKPAEVMAAPYEPIAEPSRVESAAVVAPVAAPPAEPALPATATPLPLFALGGVVSMILGLGVGLLRRH